MRPCGGRGGVSAARGGGAAAVVAPDGGANGVADEGFGHPGVLPPLCFCPVSIAPQTSPVPCRSGAVQGSPRDTARSSASPPSAVAKSSKFLGAERPREGYL